MLMISPVSPQGTLHPSHALSASLRGHLPYALVGVGHVLCLSVQGVLLALEPVLDQAEVWGAQQVVALQSMHA